MKLFVCQTYEDMSRQAAAYVSEQLTRKPDSVLGLATGSSPVGLYRELVAAYQRGVLSFRDVTSVNLDEYCGLAPDDEQSYAFFMHHHLFDQVDILPENIHLPDGTNTDAVAETARYDALIASLGGIDLQLLGIGVDGHIGFNEADDAFSTGTRRVALADSTLAANARVFASPDEVPRYAYSMGCGTIIAADRILMLASGRAKAAILEKALFGPVTPRVPASLLQLVSHKVTVFCDAEAGALLVANHSHKVICL